MCSKPKKPRKACDAQQVLHVSFRSLRRSQLRPCGLRTTSSAGLRRRQFEGCLCETLVLSRKAKEYYQMNRIVCSSEKSTLLHACAVGDPFAGCCEAVEKIMCPPAAWLTLFDMMV